MDEGGKVLGIALKQYFANIKAGISFLVLVFFAPIFMLLPQANFFSTAAFFLPFDLSAVPLAGFALTIFFALIEVFVYSLLTVILVMSVKQKISGQKPGFVKETIKKLSLRLAAFNVLFLGFFYVSGAVFYIFGFPVWILFLAIFLASLGLFYMPQSIVVDEYRLSDAVSSSLDFCMERKKDVLAPFLIAALATVAAGLIEFAFDSAYIQFLPGKLFSLLIVLGFVVPYTETLKTYCYMKKNALLSKTMH